MAMSTQRLASATMDRRERKEKSLSYLEPHEQQRLGLSSLSCHPVFERRGFYLCEGPSTRLK